MPIIYVAGPLLNGHTLTFEDGKKNWEKVVDVAEKLMQKGWTVFIPHHSLFMWKHLIDKYDRAIPWETWLVQDSGMIQVSQALYFVGHSKGADLELKYALDNDKKVYRFIDDVPKVIPDDCLLRKDTPEPKPYEEEKSEHNII